MSAWMQAVLGYLLEKGKDSFPQPWWLGSRSGRPTGFADLPVELVLHIASYITSNLGRLCLALICKSMLNILDDSKKLQRSPEFRVSTWDMLESPVDMHKAFHRMYTFHEKIQTDRWRLLVRLENARWLCCFGCFKLHPVDQFSIRARYSGASRRTCIFGNLVGVVRLCPCTEMTFRDKLRIAKELESRKTQQQQQQQQPEEPELGYEAQPHNAKGVLPGIDPVTGQHQCLHEYICWKNARFSLKVQRKLKFILDDQHNLILETECSVTDKDIESTAGIFMGNLLLCPHISVYLAIRQIKHLKGFPDPWPNHLIGRWRVLQQYPGSFSCRWCKMTIYNAQSTWERYTVTPMEYTFTTRRCLGNAIEHADDVWYHQTETSIEKLSMKERLKRKSFAKWKLLQYREPSE